MSANEGESTKTAAPRNPPEEERLLLASIVRIERHVLGMTLGLMSGMAIFIATNWLILKGGPNVGAHLRLLGQFFPGYRVSFLGSLIGLLYGFGAGYASGWMIGTIYNAAVSVRHRGKGRSPTL